jgi:hypothetical protein
VKNVQVIDGALNCEYSIFAITDAGYKLMFPMGRDVEFIGDFISRVGKKTAGPILVSMWKRPIKKKNLHGLHGTLFYQLDYKKKYYPTKKESEMVANPP